MNSRLNWKMTFQHLTLDDHEELPFGESGYLRIPMRLAERHLTAETESDKAEVQAIGTHLQVLIRSERRDMLVRLPLEDWEASKPYSRSLTGWTINLQRWKENVSVHNGYVNVGIATKENF